MRIFDSAPHRHLSANIQVSDKTILGDRNHFLLVDRFSLKLSLEDSIPVAVAGQERQDRIYADELVSCNHDGFHSIQRHDNLPPLSAI